MIKIKIDKILKKILNKINYKYNMPWDKYINQIYRSNDEEDMHFQTRKFIIECLYILSASFLLIIFISISMLIMKNINDSKEDKIIIDNNEIKIVNPEENKKIDVIAKYKINEYEIEKEYKINLPTKKMTDEQIVDNILSNITDKKIRGKNKNLYEVKQDLNLITDNEYDAQIYWECDSNNVNVSTGEVIRNYKGDGDKKAKIKVYVKYNTVKKVKIFKINVIEQEMTREELELLEKEKIISDKVKKNDIYEISDDALKNEKAKFISKVGNVEIEWKFLNKKENTKYKNTEINFLIIIISLMLIYNKYNKVKRKSLDKIHECELYFSRFVEQFIILLSAGFTPYSALDYIADNNKIKNELIVQIKRLCNQVENGLSLYNAFENFEKSIGSRMISKFVYSTIYNMKRGDNELVNFLKVELVESSKHVETLYTMRVKESNIKMMLPLMINFISIMVIVVYPAIKNLL